MTVKIVKKGSVNTKPVAFCDIFVDASATDGQEVSLMTDSRQGRFPRRLNLTTRVAIALFVLTSSARCRNAGPISPRESNSVLRIGVGEIGLDQAVQTFSVEGLAKVAADGRPGARLAKGWTVAQDGLSIIVDLRPNLRFHDGSPVSAEVIAEVLQQSLPGFMGIAYEDVSSIGATSAEQVKITLHRPSTFVLESLEAPIRKPALPRVGTGPFVSTSSTNGAELVANPDYYLGRPKVDRIVVNVYSSVRTAWAETLRDHVDMVWDVGVNLLESLQQATTVQVFSYVRNYQYLVLLNPKSPALHPPAVRRRLNASIDRDAFIRDALDGHGLPSHSPIWPQHWAVLPNPTELAPPRESSLPAAASTRPSQMEGQRQIGVKFTCLVAAEHERMGLVISRQLRDVGIEMRLEEASVDRIRRALVQHDFDAVLVDAISAPSMFRPYLWWHSRGSLNRARTLVQRWMKRSILFGTRSLTTNTDAPLRDLSKVWPWIRRRSSWRGRSERVS